VPEPAESEFAGSARFEVVRRLGAGGMGVVYEAIDREHGTRVAVKTLRNWSEDAFLRFKNEFRALQDVQHENLVRLGELLEERGQWFFTMELIQGVELLRWLRGDAAGDSVSTTEDRPPSKPSTHPSRERSTKRERPVLPGRRAGSDKRDDDSADSPTIDIPSGDVSDPLDRLVIADSTGAAPITDERRLRTALGQLARGLCALHDARRVHRDIKPSNVLVDAGGHLKILDFGLVTEQHRRAAGEEHLVGTAFYMAPEQALSESVGPEADWYAVGVILYQALTGRLPFVGPPQKVIAVKQAVTVTPPGQISPGIPPELDRLCTELLSIDPKARPGGREVLRRLQIEAEEAKRVRISSSSTHFVGRHDELQVLSRAFHDVGEGRALTVLVHGESGVGKSALTRRFTDRLTADAAAVVFFGRCYERESVPYKAIDDVVDALSRYLGLLEPEEVRALLPPEAHLLGQVFPVLRRLTNRPVGGALDNSRAQAAPLDPQDLRARTFEVFRELLARLAARRPLVLVIDDLQWADADSLALLAELLRPPGPPLLLVATLRSALEHEGATRSLEQLKQKLRGEVRALRLTGLSPDDARALVDQILRSAEHDGPDEAARAQAIDPSVIAKEAAGHPLFIDELVRGRLVLGDESPVDLEDVLWARIERMPPPARHLLELVATAGAPIVQDVTARAADLAPGPFADEMARLRAAHLVRTTGARRSDAVESYHDRVRNAVRARLEPDAQSELHRKLAVALEQQAGRRDDEALATHWRAAGEPARAADYALRAAAAADEALAFERAAHWYRLALKLLPADTPDVHKLQTRLGDALTNAGRGPEAASAYVAAAAAAPESVAADALIELRRRAADQWLRSGHIDEGLATLDAVLGASGMKLPPSANRALVRLLFTRARIRMRLRGLAFDERAERDVDVLTLRRIDACWSVAAGLGLVDNVRGSYFQSRGLVLALKAGEPFRIARALAAEAAFSSSAGGPSHERTMKLLAAADAIAARVADPYAVAWCTGAGGIAGTLEGRWATAQEQCERGETIFREKCVGVAWELAMMRWFSLWSIAYLGKLDELARRVPLRLRDAEGRGDLNAVIGHSTGLANLVWLAADDPDEAARRGEEAVARWSHKTFHVQHWWNLLGQTQVDLYRGEGAAAHKRVVDQWPGLKSSLLLMVQLTRLEATHLRARAALQAATQVKEESSRFLAAAARDAKKIAGERMPWSTPLAQLLDAGIAAARGEQERAATLLPTAIDGLGAAGMTLYAAAARLVLGRLLGGDEGARLTSAAGEWMTAQGVKQPARLAAMLAPGFAIG
jgi:serine/threonine protein kinase